MTGAAPLPHCGVHVRLGLSAIHGIGVFAIKDIQEGTKLFADDHSGLVWIDRAELERMGLSDAQSGLYHDFCIQAGASLGCPRSFTNLTPGWYLNQPRPLDAANVRVDEDLNFFAARAIAEDEELTVSYGELNAAGAEYLERRRSFGVE